MNYSTALKSKTLKLVNYTQKDPIMLQEKINNLKISINKLKKENKSLKDYIDQIEFQEYESDNST